MKTRWRWCVNTLPILFRADATRFDQILRRVQLKQGAQTSVDFKTLPGGSPSVEATVGPFYPDALVLPNPVSLPSVLLSSLRRTHKLRTAPHVCLVEITSDSVTVLTTYGSSNASRTDPPSSRSWNL
jgi:hypothetical protein